MPKGGARINSGPKRKATVLTMPQSQAAATPPVPVSRPAGMKAGDRQVWDRLAPIATARGTLTPDTVPGFELLCQSITLLADFRRRIDHDGWTYASRTGEPRRHPLWGSWHQLHLRVEQELARFGLMADGKVATMTATAAANPWAAIAPER